MRPTAVGGRPFSLRAGPVAGAAHELVWIHGDLAVGYMGRPLRADVLAVCSQDPSSSGARQVLAYLPADLVRPYRGVADHYGDTDAVTEARVREIASTTGLRFTKYQPTFGTNLNRTFPGALSGAWIVPVSMYVFAAVGLLGAAGSIFLALVHDDALGTSSRIALGSFGVAMVVIGILMLPSVARSIRRKQAATAGERSGDEPRPRSVTPPTGPTNLGP